MARITAKDNQTGDTVTFDWNGQGDPSDEDMHQVFVAAQKVPKSLPAPPESDSLLKGGLWTGSIEPMIEGAKTLVKAPWQKQADGSKTPQWSLEGDLQNLKGFAGMFYDPMEAEWGKALQAAREQRPGEYAYRAFAGSIPIVGPMLGKALDTGLAGRPREAIGQAAIGLPLSFAAPEIAGEVAGAAGKAISKAKASPAAAGLQAGLGKAGMAAVGKNFPVIGPAIKVGLEAAENAKLARAAGEAAKPGAGVVSGAGDLAAETASKLRMMQAAREAAKGGGKVLPGAGEAAAKAAESVARVRTPIPSTGSATPLMPPPEVSYGTMEQFGGPITSSPEAGLTPPPATSPQGEVADFAEYIKNNRKSKSNVWADPQVLQEEAVNAALDAGKRQESAAAGMGSGFEPGLDQPTPRWNPQVNSITDPTTGQTIKGTFDPRTGSVTPTLPKPPEFATFGPDELLSLPELQKRLAGKRIQGASTLGKPEANLAKLDRLTQQFGDKVPEGQVTPVSSPEGGLYLLYKKGGKITDYALLEEGPEGVVLQERVRGGKASPDLESPGMAAIKDALWGLKDKFRVNPSSMSEGALKSWMKYRPKKK